MMKLRLEFKLADMWIGVFWRKSKMCIPQGAPSYTFPICDVVEVWICLVPCFPIHIWRVEKGSDPPSAAN
jgi:hypothetical protein